MEEERHVLVVLPHPDDESFGSAGSIALFTRAGVPVTYACATLGQMGRNMGNPLFASRESLPLLREKELRDACAVIGIRDLRLLGLRDKTLEFEDPDELADRVEALVNELDPSLVITFYPGYGVHPDHNAMGAATIRAIGRMDPGSRPVVRCHAISRNRMEALGEPDVIVDIREVSDVKLAAIRAHRTQTEAMLAEMETRMASDPAFREEIEKNRSQEMYWTYRFA